MSAPSTTDILVYKGGDFNLRFQPENASGLPVDLRGSTGEMHVRASSSDPTLLLNLTTANGGLSIDPNQQTLGIRIAAAQTLLLNFTNAVYDLFLTAPNGTVTPLIHGAFNTVSPVTRPQRNTVRAVTAPGFVVGQRAGFAQASVSPLFYINR